MDNCDFCDLDEFWYFSGVFLGAGEHREAETGLESGGFCAGLPVTTA